MTVDIAVLGKLLLSRDGVLVALPSLMHRRLLLTLLVSRGRVVTDDVLIDRLWSGNPPDSARFSLRNHVARLRSAVGAELIERGDSGYRLRAESYRTDLARFDEQLATARDVLAGGDPAGACDAIDEALALVRGSPFVDVRDQWWAADAARDVDEKVMLAEELWAAARLRSTYVGREISRLHHAAVAQPQREIRWQQLIEAQCLSGRRTEAVRSAQEAREALAQFGMTPGPGLLAAERAALGAGSSDRSPTPGARRLDALRASPMVGRDGALGPVAGQAAVVWVEAEPGHGKSRFAAEVAHRAQLDGDRVLYAAAEERQVGFALLADMVRELLAAQPADRRLPDEVNLLLGRPVVEQLPGGLSEVRHAHLRAYVSDLLEDVAALGPILVIIDDVHLSTAEVLDALAHIIERAGRATRFVLTSGPAPEIGDGPVRSLLARLDGRMVPHRIVLGPLMEHEVAELAAHLVPARASDDRAGLVRQIHNASGGDPLAASELLRHRAASVGHGDASKWVPPRLASILSEALDRLDQEPRLVADAISLFDTACPIDALPPLTGLDERRVAEALGALRAERVLGETFDDVVSFRLPLLHELARSRVGRDAQQHMRRRLIASLDDHRANPELVARQLLALDRLSAQERAVLDEAVVRALTMLVGFDFAAALAFSRAYIGKVGTGGASRMAVQAQVLAATAFLAGGDAEQGRALLDLTVAKARAFDAELLTDALLARGPIDTGSPRALEIAAEAEQLFQRLPASDVVRRVQLGCWAAHHYFNLGRWAEGCGLLDSVSAIDLFDERPMWRGLVLAVRLQAEQLNRGRPHRARGAHQDLQAWGRLTGDLLSQAGSMVLGIPMGHIDGTLEDVRAARAELLVHSDVVPRADLLWLPDVIEAGMALAVGEFEQADLAIRAAERRGRQLQVEAARSAALTQSTLLMILTGTIATLSAVLEEASAQPDASPLVVATFGLSAARAGEFEAARGAAKLLAQRNAILAKVGLPWSALAAIGSELAWLTGDVDLADRLWSELRPWSGAGLTVQGVAYFGAADTWLGLLALVRGRRVAGLQLLRSAIAQERRRGAAAMERRAESFLEVASAS